ncbi:MAG: hypothetical protein ABW221_16800 [Vicinamibacteria bacterium]
MGTRSRQAPAATVEPIRATRKALAELVEASRLEEALPLARFVLREVEALERAGFTRPVRSSDLALCHWVVENSERARAVLLSPLAPA